VWTRQTAIILTGTFLFTKYVARLMIEQGRRATSSTSSPPLGIRGSHAMWAIARAKSGLLNFTRSVAMELAEYGIRVNSLTPTATDPREGMERAARWGKSYGDPRIVGLLEEVRKGVPLQKLPSPRHYARAAVFLASDDAEMITGTDLRVDAGTVARYWAWTPEDKT